MVVYINSQFLGVGEEALGTLLMRAFLKTLPTRRQDLPDHLHQQRRPTNFRGI